MVRGDINDGVVACIQLYSREGRHTSWCSSMYTIMQWCGETYIIVQHVYNYTVVTGDVYNGVVACIPFYSGEGRHTLCCSSMYTI